MRRIEDRETGGVVVFKLGRFGRTLVDSLGLIDRIEKADASFASVSDGFDLTTETGRLVLRIMLSLAEFELERIRANWDEARARAVRRGVRAVWRSSRSATRARTTGGWRRIRSTGRSSRRCSTAGRRARDATSGDGWRTTRAPGRNAGATSGRCGRCAMIAIDVYRDRLPRRVLHARRPSGPDRRGDVPARATQRAPDRVARLRTGVVGRHLEVFRVSVHPARADAEARGRPDRPRLPVSVRFRRGRRVVPGTGDGHGCGRSGRSWSTHSPRCATSKRRRRSATARTNCAPPRMRRARPWRTTPTIRASKRRSGWTTTLPGWRHARPPTNARRRPPTPNRTPPPRCRSARTRASLRASWPQLTTDEKRRLLGGAIDCVFVKRREGRTVALADRTHVCWRGTAPDKLPGRVPVSTSPGR